MSVFIVVVSFLLLIVLHELGHFVFAKRYGVKVEEFGIGLPPRLFGKRFGETLYSLNLLPLGAFVRLEGEEKSEPGPRSFSSKPIWQRMVIVAAGVAAFWLVAVLIFAGLGMTTGIPTGIADEEVQGVANPKVQIVGVAPDSPAQAAGIELGDTIEAIELSKTGVQVFPTTVAHVQEFVASHTGETFFLTLTRAGGEVKTELAARAEHPADEGPMGVALVRTGLVKYGLLTAPLEAAERTFVLTREILKTLWQVSFTLVSGRGVPEGTQFMGPVGIVHFLNNSLTLGISQFLSFFAVLAIYLAIFNALPIPVVDGGKLALLALEGIRKKPLPEAWVNRVSAVFFVLLITLMIWVTIKDIGRII